MGWFADMDDVKFTIELPIEEEDRDYLMKQIMKQCDISKMNMEKIIESYIDNKVSSPSRFKLLNRKRSVVIKQ